jgi:transcriptional accessory protein Tex/SPT6
MRGFTWSAIGIEAVPQERIRTAEELGVHQHQIAAAISLLDGGATVRFVAY